MSNSSDPFAPGGSGRSHEAAPGTEWGGYGSEQWGSAEVRPRSGGARWAGPSPAAPTPGGNEPPYGYPTGGPESFDGQAREHAWDGSRSGTARRSRGYLALVSLLGLVAVTAVVVAVVALTGGFNRTPTPSPSPGAWSYGSNPALDARWDECSSGDMAACDSLYNAAPRGTDYHRFGSTCGDTTGPTYGGCQQTQIEGYGDDARLDSLWDSCEAGDMKACDDLYFSSQYGTDYEAFGSTCGGTEDEQWGGCDFLGAEGYGTSPSLDVLWDDCAAGDWVSCDELYFTSPWGTEYESFGSTCGGTSEPRQGECAAIDYSAYGDDAYRDGLWDRCEDGVLPDCDELFIISWEGTEYLEFADTCGGTAPANGEADCINPDHDAYGSDPYLDGLYDECGAGDRESCLDLYYIATWGTEYQKFATTCGGTVDEDDYRNLCM